MVKRSFLLLLCFSLVLPGCSALSFLNPMNLFNDEPEGEQPAKLVGFVEEVSLRRQWRVRVGKGQGDKYNRLSPVIQGEYIYAAGADGIVLAVNLETGRNHWRIDLDTNISGGVGVSEDLVLLGSENSEVIALDRETGEVLWQTEVSSEVLAAPKTNGGIVVAQSVDGKLAGLDAQTGAEVWIYESTVPALSLRGTSSPLISGDFVIAGFGNGTIVSVALDNGTLRWEQRVTIPTGRSEIDRMVDIDGELYITDNGLLLAQGYQGYLVAIDVVTGQKRWQVEESSSMGASEGFSNIYISNERGHVKAYRTGEDDLIWENTLLDLRRLSPPTTFNSFVAVADFEGYVHLLSQVDGRFVGRTRVDNNGVRATMLAQDNILYVFGNSGRLVALSVQ